MRIASVFVLILVATTCPISAATAKKKPAASAIKKPAIKLGVSGRKITVPLKSTARKGRQLFSPWRVPTFAKSTVGDATTGEDLRVRQAAVAALGPRNGTIVVSQANTGRILAVVNQKLALEAGYQPCSTVKVPVALAGLRELVIDRQDLVRVGGRTKLDMTQALAHSNNAYFAKLGTELGFDRVSTYAKTFGLGELAGLGIEGENPGALPPTTPKSGMGMMTSFGDGIRLTPLQLTALMGAVANGGTLYYLQYPRNADQVEKFIPEVKRQLDIAEAIPDVMPGLAGAVDFGTARRIGTKHPEPIYGKTGTCTDTRTPTHLGWFSSFSDVGDDTIVVTVLLTGGRGVSGPIAAGVAGNVYRRLQE